MTEMIIKERLHVEEEEEYDIKEVEKKHVKHNKLIWPMIIYFFLKHLFSLYGIYLVFTEAKWTTSLFAYILVVISNIGASAGAHRLWAHKAYKAKLPLRILLLIMYTMSFQGPVLRWARDHRVHHKYTETDADPHNSMRGFFFSHVGWLLVKKHPEVISKGRTIDLTDLESDPILRIHKKYYYSFVFIVSFCIPVYTALLWGETFWNILFVVVILRHTFALHMIFFVNSAAHMWGYKPYDNTIRPGENKIISFFGSGEGFHNYHHAFPWDYRNAELGGYRYNISWVFIDMMAKIGWAYDLKSPTEEMIKNRVLRTGDGTHPVWGWDDLSAESKQSVKVL